MPLQRLFRFSLGLYTLDITTKSENKFARRALTAGVFSIILNLIGFWIKARIIFLAAGILGLFSIGLGIKGLLRHAELLSSKYRDFSVKQLLYLGKKRSWLGIILGLIGLGLGIYCY